MWRDNDELKDYSEGIKKSFEETFDDCMDKGGEIGANIGSIFGRTGEKIGGVIGTVAGAAVGIVKGVANGVANIFSGGGCYITTATCEEYGKPDDCYELTMFRDFRDNWLMQQEDGQTLIDEYYNTAPDIVEKINNQPNRAEIYRFIRDNYLSKCLKYIENNRPEECKSLYKDMMYYLYKEQNKWV